MADLTTDAAKALEGVTPGPWLAESGHMQSNGQLYWQVTDGHDAILQNQFCWHHGDHAATARFVAWCREGVPALVAELTAQKARAETAEAQVAELTAKLEVVTDAIDGIYVYANDTMGGPSAGPDDRAWYLDGVVEIRDRAMAFADRNEAARAG